MKTIQKFPGLHIDDSFLMSIAGTVFIGIGLFCLASGKLTTLSCNRDQANESSCHLASKGLFDFQQSPVQPIKLHSAELEDNPMNKDTARVLLSTNRGYLHFTSSTSDDKAKATVAHINNFINEAQTNSITLQNDERGLYLPLGSFIIAVGLGTLVFFRNSRLRA
ncbi:MAG: hypothetical protein ABI417_00330 [Coleofasciculaceae cyanobacterium]